MTQAQKSALLGLLNSFIYVWFFNFPMSNFKVGSLNVNGARDARGAVIYETARSKH